MNEEVKRWLLCYGAMLVTHQYETIDANNAKRIFKKCRMKGCTVDFKTVLPILRYALTQHASGPDVFGIVERLGWKECHKRIERWILTLKQ